MPFQPPIVDKAGRGALCAQIDELAKAALRFSRDGARPDPDEQGRVLVQLDAARAKFHRLYGHTPRPHEDT